MKLSALLKGIVTQSAFEDVEIERVTDKSEEITKNSNVYTKIIKSKISK